MKTNYDALQEEVQKLCDFQMKEAYYNALHSKTESSTVYTNEITNTETANESSNNIK